MNEYYFQIDVSEEQVDYANSIVDYSILNHPVTDIFANDPQGKERQREFRFTGSLGEIVFADAYQLPRPTRAFGAIDGQDYGMDFKLTVKDKAISFDIKSMGRKNNNFRENYVLNLPKYQMEKDMVITDCYFCISIHEEFNHYIASFIGYIEKELVYQGKVGILYKAGTKRIKDDGGSFIFQRDTYEVDFKDIRTPFVTEHIKKIKGFKQRNILPPYKK
ncbi:MAG: hypothetical protein JNN12_17205 [Bacteroidetes Order II. Incertae sedis bacterium]|nr:hypothetical protein [Bacteroidetes Order II. bacterium]